MAEKGVEEQVLAMERLQYNKCISHFGCYVEWHHMC